MTLPNLHIIITHGWWGLPVSTPPSPMDDGFPQSPYHHHPRV